MPGIVAPRLPRREIYFGFDNWMKQKQDNQESLQYLVQALKDQEEHLKEVLDAIERRDMTAGQVKEYLKWVQRNMREVRRSPKFGVSKVE